MDDVKELVAAIMAEEVRKFIEDNREELKARVKARLEKMAEQPDEGGKNG